MEQNCGAQLTEFAQPDAFIALDAGNIFSGLSLAEKQGILSPLLSGSDWEAERESCTEAGFFMRKRIKSYLISHSHLDHLSGLAIVSAEDDFPKNSPAKTIIGLNVTIDKLAKNIFNWETWPNLASEGAAPALNKYQCSLSVHFLTFWLIFLSRYEGS